VDGALTGIAPIRPLQLCDDGGYQLRLGVLGVPGVAPEASEEWFDSFEVLMPFVMPRSVWLFPHANW
jgi:hypothetical protein